MLFHVSVLAPITNLDMSICNNCVNSTYKPFRSTRPCKGKASALSNIFNGSTTRTGSEEVGNGLNSFTFSNLNVAQFSNDNIIPISNVETVRNY